MEPSDIFQNTSGISNYYNMNFNESQAINFTNNNNNFFLEDNTPNIINRTFPLLNQNENNNEENN